MRQRTVSAIRVVDGREADDGTSKVPALDKRRDSEKDAILMVLARVTYVKNRKSSRSQICNS